MAPGHVSGTFGVPLGHVFGTFLILICTFSKCSADLLGGLWGTFVTLVLVFRVVFGPVSGGRFWRDFGGA